MKKKYKKVVLVGFLVFFRCPFPGIGLSNDFPCIYFEYFDLRLPWTLKLFQIDRKKLRSKSAQKVDDATVRLQNLVYEMIHFF